MPRQETVVGLPREFLGGPFHREVIVCHPDSSRVIMPMPKRWRKDPKIREWAVYDLCGEDMKFDRISLTPKCQ